MEINLLKEEYMNDLNMKEIIKYYEEKYNLSKKILKNIT